MSARGERARWTVLAGLTFAMGASAPSAHAQLPVDRAAIDAVFADIDPGAPGCALGVVGEGRLLYGRGYGLANLEHGIPLTTSSVFRTASVSKQFTGAVVALAAFDLPLTVVGRVVAGDGTVHLMQSDGGTVRPPAQGWEHFTA